MSTLPEPSELLPTVPLSRLRSRRGRPVSTATPLGRMIRARGLRVGDVAALSGMSERKLSDYVRGVKPVRPLDMVYLCRALNCQPDELS